MKIQYSQIKIYFCIIIIALTFILYFIVQYGQIPMGDDILFQFKDSFLWYTKKSEWHPTQIIDTFPLMIKEVCDRWKLFSGRLTTVVLVPLLNIGGQKICSFIGAFTYTSIILCIGKLAWEDVFQHPFGLAIISMFQYALTSTALYMQLWTFVCHYAIPTLLCLLYIIYTKRNKRQSVDGKNAIFLTFLGGITGATHELIGGYCIIIIFFDWLQSYVQGNTKSFLKDLRLHVGLIVGYAVCLLAPGNLFRIKIEHDKSRITTSIFEKIRISIGAHIYALGIGDVFPTLIVLVAFVLILISVRIEKRRFKDFIINNMALLLSIMISIFMWAAVAPPVAPYGLQIWKALFIVFIFRNIRIEYHNRTIYCMATSILIFFCIWQNWKWTSELLRIGNLRREQIESAIAEDEEIVFVSQYPDITSNYMTMFNLANENEFSGEFGKEFYGIEVYPEGY